ncbi:MAG: hypothetical protein C4555_03250 [Dehalococcoidia bacterium]|nr:MAG: hypothetical protein C4555_03250 [Dehalococcoidia bacterium]
MANEYAEELPYPKVPSQVKVSTFDDLNSVLENHSRFFRDISRYQDELMTALHAGYLIRDFRVENLSADKIIAGTIGVDQIYLFDNKFELNGALQQIIVKDNQASPVTRVEIGKFGSGADYGIKIRNSSGTVVFQATSTTFIDGAVITNATISDSKIIGMDGSKLTDGTVTNGKIASLSANKITLSGTLTCTSSTTAINVTSAGVVIFSGGGDMIFKATASDSNFISFRNSGNTEKGSIIYSPSSDVFSINNANGSDIFIDAQYGSGTRNVTVRAGSTLSLTSISGATITVGSNITLAPSTVVQVNGNMRADTNNTRSLGTSSIKYSDMWTVVDHVGDIEFDNGWRFTEPDKVYDGAKPEDGLLIMNSKWEVMGGFDKYGNLWVKGFVKPLHDFYPPNIAKRESSESEENYDRERKVLN